MKTDSVKKEKFDCVAFKHEVQAKIYEEIKNLPPQEEIDYFRKRAEEGSLGAWWKEVKAQTRERKPK